MSEAPDKSAPARSSSQNESRKPKATKTLKEFKEFMGVKSHDYQLVSETDNTLSYKKEIPAKRANCTTAGCLFLLGIVPGVIYYFATSKDAQVLTLNVVLKEGSLVVSGDSALKFENGYNKFRARNKTV